MSATQKHLDKVSAVNLGSFYTPQSLVLMAYALLQRYIGDLSSYVLLDSSCGYGDFFIKNLNYIGADIDEIALNRLQSKVKNAKTLCTNSLHKVSRAKFSIKDEQKLIIIGNPPYNDKTSLLKSKIKKEIFECDKALKHRDLGISFLRSFELLKPDFICILHPLSYLVKETNFKALKQFKEHYKLIDSLIISSQFFTPNSSSFFPIIIALYEKNENGMDFKFIQNYLFKSVEGQKFKLKDFDFITNYVCKYPNLKDEREAVAYFYPLRDINALKRNQSFLQGRSQNAIKVFKDNLKYYIYIHFFKQYSKNLPYFLGNLDIFIKHNAFLKIEDEFLAWFYQKPFDEVKIKAYFENLFDEFRD